MVQPAGVYIHDILLIGAAHRKLVEQLEASGYRPVVAPDLQSVPQGLKPCALTIVSQELAAPLIQGGLERAYFLNDAAPILVLIDEAGRIDENLRNWLRNGTIEALYVWEVDAELVSGRIDRAFLVSQLDNRLVSFQHQSSENDLLRKEIRFRDQAIARSHEMNARILMSVASGVVVIDIAGSILLVNEHACRFLDLTPAVVGAHFGKVLRDQERQLVSQLLVSEGARETAACKVRSGGQYLQISALAMKEAGGQLAGILLLAQDITAQEQTTQQLHRAERLASIGTMLSGIAHELRNPLSIISARCQWAKISRNPTPEKMLKSFVSIDKQSERCASIVNRLLDFAHVRASTAIFAPVREIVAEVLDYARHHAPFGSLDIRLSVDDDLLVYGDRQRYVQLLLNLVTNAIDAMGGRGELRVRARAADTPHMVQIEIGDTGPGIDPQIRDRIFDPFFTTKDPGKGTGLGLPIAHTIATESGGQISYSSQPGDTRFTVVLPSERERTR